MECDLGKLTLVGWLVFFLTLVLIGEDRFTDDQELGLGPVP